MRPHFGGFWALVLAIQDRHWLECRRQGAAAPGFAALERRKAESPVGRSALEAELDRLGVRGQPTSSRPEKK